MPLKGLSIVNFCGDIAAPSIGLILKLKDAWVIAA